MLDFNLCACALLLAATFPTFANADGSRILTALDAAKAFGGRESIEDISMSPDGKRLVFIAPGPGQSTVVMVSDMVDGVARPVAHADGMPGRLVSCDWSANDRIVCSQYGVSEYQGLKLPVLRLLAFDADGKNMKALGRGDRPRALGFSNYDGRVIDWLAGDDGTVLMSRSYVPEQSTGTRLSSSRSGLGVDRVDTRTLQSVIVEQAVDHAARYLSDGRGVVRIMALDNAIYETGVLRGTRDYRYRLVGEKFWRPFSRVNLADKTGLYPVAIDPIANAAYALQIKDGRQALYRVSLDGKLTTALIYANPTVDVEGIITVGRRNRIIGASYVTDRREAAYFDPDYIKLAKSLSKALPGLPLIRFAGASADEKRLLLFAGSDIDPGRYYVFDRQTSELNEVLLSRPDLEKVALAPVKSVSYRAPDGTMIPAYLTMPPTQIGKPIAAIVMPHGGPASRDEWGFDWFAQFFAHRGYAVLQANFRGSSGYGDAWYAENGFKSWKLAVGDVAAGGRWLIDQKIVDAGKLAILGWSYGGYAALQSSVVAPGLFKAIVAVAPVTDLAMLKQEAAAFTSSALVARYIGSGPHVTEGSPLRQVEKISAPVLMFHGDQDVNVSARESREMDSALRQMGKRSELVMFPGLDHQLHDSLARSTMLARSDQFLRSSLNIE